MKRLLFLVCLPICCFGQNTIGLPDVINYSRESYSAGLQNWDIRQDKNGIIYIANNEGLLTFDGKNWKLYPLPNRTIARSVEIAPDGRIYVGGQDELGYFTPGPNGRLQYHSIIESVPAKDRSFGDVWDIVAMNKDVFFRASNKIFKLTNEAIATYHANGEWSYMGVCNGRLFAHDYSTGLMAYNNNVWSPLSVSGNLPPGDPVTSLMPAGGDSILVTTLKNGWFMLTGSGLTKVHSANNQLFASERIYSAIPVNNEWMALATNNSGVYITDRQGNIIQSFSKTEGLQNNNVLSIFLDNQSNLWLGLDNGIDFIAYNSAIKHITPNYQDGSGYTALIHDNHLFMGTSNGLFSVPLQVIKDMSFSKGHFSAVQNTKGQTWGLAEINNQLLLGHHEGAFTVSENSAKQISADPGFWNFVPLSTTFPSAMTVAGNYRGLHLIEYDGKRFIPKGNIPGFQESCRFVAIDRDDNIWVSHPYHGVYRLTRRSDGSYNVFTYTDKNGLPSLLNNHIYKIKNEVVVATEKGVYVYNSATDKFEVSPFYQKILGTQSLRYLKEDVAGNIWFIHEKVLGVVDFSGKEPVLIYLPELNNKMLSGFEFIYAVNENNIFLGGEKGFFHINYEKYRQTLSNVQVQIRTVRIINKTDSLLFGGYFSSLNEKQKQDPSKIPEVDHYWKTIRFEFSSTLFGYQPNLEYSYRLKGFDENWSAWAKRTEKEYTNLPYGNYSFELKVRNNLGNESEIASYSFVVLPPWYQTIWANILYGLFAIGIVFAIYKFQRKKFIQQKQKYEEEQKRLLYIHELELSKNESELVALRNEKLETEINFKNTELASSAMHLVKKGELLAKMKAELTQIMKGIDNPQALTELKKLNKTLGEDDNIDKEWENFAKHFDKVHSDFLVDLKEKYPTITSNELKLCAYLRMNLSTKEIAQLMNISVRGVEISRYRLRKKLKISSDTNLFDHLMNFTGKSEE